jgi:hypothetical protein
MKLHQEYICPSISTPASDLTISEAGRPYIPTSKAIDGYLSDPGVDIDFFEEKQNRSKRKFNILEIISDNVKFRRVERTVHLKK